MPLCGAQKPLHLMSPCGARGLALWALPAGVGRCVCRMGSLSLPSTMAEEMSCAPHLRGVHPTIQLLKCWRPTRWLDPLGQWERHAGPAVGKGGSSCCTRSAGPSDDARHLCEVSQAAQTPAWASSSPQRPGSQAQRKGRKRFWEWQAGAGPSRQGWPWLEGLTAVRGPPLGAVPAWEGVLLMQGRGRLGLACGRRAGLGGSGFSVTTLSPSSQEVRLSFAAGAVVWN